MVRFIASALAASSLCMVDAKQYNADVIVVGAGYSGLGAARELQRAGVDVVVLEARDRVGGRTWVKEFQNRPLDMGGAWIEGGQNNPLVALQAEYGLTPATTGDHHPISNQYSFDYELYTGNSYTNDVFRPYNQASNNARREVGKSLYEAVSEGNNWDSVDQKRWNSTASHVMELDYAGTVEEIDSRTMMQYDCGFRWTCTAYWPETGFGGPKGMAETLANAEALDIQYETVVTSVEQDGSTVTFQTESGDVYTANRAVVTIPLGVLKANDVNFDPPLSSAKQTAIERLGFGTCNKIFMAFDEVSFSSAPWASGSAPMDYFAVEAAKEDQPSWFMNIHEHPIYGGVPVIGAWVCGPDAMELEYDTDLFVERAMEKLRKLYPTLGDPTDTAFSGWNADRFARGAYSFPGVGSVIQDYDTMAAQEGLLHFAGEHTTRTWGSVNGAFESGKDAAQEILSAKQGLKNTSGSRRPAERTDKSQENLGKPGFSYLFR